MKEDELRSHAICAACGKKIGHAGVPIFWTIKIERHGLKKDALDRQMGLTTMLGGHAALARVMGTNEEMTMPLMSPVTATICEPCSLKPVLVAALAEQLHDPDEDEDEDEEEETG